ncbi:MAG TPA: hypothetical protein VJA25_01305 [Dehalococcoidia bacterium]|nr:hypothetical protein [Dehalococcoidia bacterium]
MSEQMPLISTEHLGYNAEGQPILTTYGVASAQRDADMKVLEEQEKRHQEQVKALVEALQRIAEGDVTVSAMVVALDALARYAEQLEVPREPH